MKTDKTNKSTAEDCDCSTRMYTGKNNEIICVRVYKGDWGDWDEKPTAKTDADSKIMKDQFFDTDTSNS